MELLSIVLHVLDVLFQKTAKTEMFAREAAVGFSRSCKVGKLFAFLEKFVGVVEILAANPTKSSFLNFSASLDGVPN